MSKILFYINSIPCNGGAERVIVNLANSMSIDADVIMVTTDRRKSEYSLNDSVNRIVLEKKKIKSRILRNITRIIKLRRTIKQKKPEIVIAFMAEPNVRAILSNLFLKSKVIISVRNDPKKEYPGIFGRIISKIILPMADGCVFQTKEAKEWFPIKLQKKSEIIPNAVRKDFYEVHKEMIKNRVVACGRLERQKNYELMITAFSAVVGKIPDAQLLIYGEGSEKEKIIQKIKDLKLDRHVYLMGKTEDVALKLSKANAFVMSSDFEGMPNALMEAMAVGLPCIATDCPCGGPKALINDQISGILVPVGDSKALSLAIIRVLLDKEFANQLASKASIDSQQYKSEVIHDRWKEFIEKVKI